jgi:hypothetical protein
MEKFLLRRTLIALRLLSRLVDPELGRSRF